MIDTFQLMQHSVNFLSDGKIIGPMEPMSHEDPFLTYYPDSCIKNGGIVLYNAGVGPFSSGNYSSELEKG